MQIISGIVLDKYDLRVPAFLAIFMIAIGLFGFTYATALWSMCCCRILMGIGCSFATTLYMKSATIWTSAKTFAFISSLLATATMLGAAVGSAPVAVLFHYVGWKNGLITIAYLGFILSVLAIIFVTKKRQDTIKTMASLSLIKQVIFNRHNIWLLFYSGLTFSPIIIIGGLWGVPFLELKFSTSASEVAKLISIMFIGHAIGSPVWALVSMALGNKKQIMIFANIISIISLSLIIFANTTYFSAELLFFTFGFCVGVFMLSFDLCRQINGVAIIGFAVAYINSGEGIVGSILEPGIGLVLDLINPTNTTHFSLSSYQYGLSVLPLCYLVSTFIIYKLPFKHETEVNMDTIAKTRPIIEGI
ncbi:MAG: MFS transporter [Legionellales bacterium]